MTASVPNGFSQEDLQKLLAQAQSEESVESEGCPQDGLTDYQQRIIKVAEDRVQSALDELSDPLVHKAMLIIICHRFIDFHNHIGAKYVGTDEAETAAAWLRDAGKFQAILNILASIQCGDNDFMTD